MPTKWSSGSLDIIRHSIKHINNNDESMQRFYAIGKALSRMHHDKSKNPLANQLHIYDTETSIVARLSKWREYDNLCMLVAEKYSNDHQINNDLCPIEVIAVVFMISNTFDCFLDDCVGFLHLTHILEFAQINQDIISMKKYPTFYYILATLMIETKADRGGDYNSFGKQKRCLCNIVNIKNKHVSKKHINNNYKYKSKTKKKRIRRRKRKSQKKKNCKIKKARIRNGSSWTVNMNTYNMNKNNAKQYSQMSIKDLNEIRKQLEVVGFNDCDVNRMNNRVENESKNSYSCYHTLRTKMNSNIDIDNHLINLNVKIASYQTSTNLYFCEKFIFPTIKFGFNIFTSNYVYTMITSRKYKESIDFIDSIEKMIDLYSNRNLTILNKLVSKQHIFTAINIFRIFVTKMESHQSVFLNSSCCRKIRTAIDIFIKNMKRHLTYYSGLGIYKTQQFTDIKPIDIWYDWYHNNDRYNVEQWQYFQTSRRRYTFYHFGWLQICQLSAQQAMRDFDRLFEGKKMNQFFRQTVSKVYKFGKENNKKILYRAYQDLYGCLKRFLNKFCIEPMLPLITIIENFPDLIKLYDDLALECLQCLILSWCYVGEEFKTMKYAMWLKKLTYDDNMFDGLTLKDDYESSQDAKRFENKGQSVMSTINAIIFEEQRQTKCMLERLKIMVEIGITNRPKSTYSKKRIIKIQNQFDKCVTKRLFTNQAFRNLCNVRECGYYNSKTTLLKKCSKCKNVFYCSRICQKKDWNGGHNNVCTVNHIKNILSFC